jgi:hypothetical protein
MALANAPSLALTFAQPVAPAKSKKRTKRKNSEDTSVAAVRAGGCDDANGQRSPPVLGILPTPGAWSMVAAMVGVAWRVNGLPSASPWR